MRRILALVIAHEPFKPPSARAAVTACILDHHVDSAAIAFDNHTILLGGLAQFINDDRSIREVPRRIALHRLLIRKNMMHSLLAFRERAAGHEQPCAYISPASKIFGILHGISPKQGSDGEKYQKTSRHAFILPNGSPLVLEKIQL